MAKIKQIDMYERLKYIKKSNKQRFLFEENISTCTTGYESHRTIAWEGYKKGVIFAYEMGIYDTLKKIETFRKINKKDIIEQ